MKLDLQFIFAIAFFEGWDAKFNDTAQIQFRISLFALHKSNLDRKNGSSKDKCVVISASWLFCKVMIRFQVIVVFLGQLRRNSIEVEESLKSNFQVLIVSLFNFTFHIVIFFESYEGETWFGSLPIG